MNRKVSKNNEQPILSKLKIKNGKPMVSSLVVAELFQLEHKSVLKAIRCLEIPDEFNERNFAPVSIEVEKPNGEKIRESSCYMTRDGFTMLAMETIGKKSIECTINVFEAFNDMDERLKRELAEMQLYVRKGYPVQ
ncbi:Rha family transcriptional regulator [Maridesulfovibrio sp.]|uniref:Rha family transcriptional regulator n=1 Tax=Maridesulfovibrio sp. TaxID=2795000 RepID=UPI0029CA266C|nr:Rha family transcriptional regulator [Maridesulfovibrio sp.]